MNQSLNDNKIYEETISQINEYSIKKDNSPITIFISKGRNNVYIRSISYEIKLTSSVFSTLANQSFNSVDEVYKFLKNIFDENNIFIQEVSSQNMKLILNTSKKKIEIVLSNKKEINSYILNDLFNKYLRLEESITKLDKMNKKLIEENKRIKEENSKYKKEFTNMKNDMNRLVTQNLKNENNINILQTGIDKINRIIDSSNKNTNNELRVSNKSRSNEQSIKTSKINNIKLSNKSTNKSQKESNEQDLKVFDDEQLFQTQDGRVIFRNGLLNDIIKKYAEINSVVNKIQLKLKKGVKFNIIYKASELGDNASIFHEKCDNYKMTLVIIETKKGVRFGGFTSQNWYGKCLQKKDDNAFVFSIDKNKIYDIIKGENAIGCYPKFGPVFFGCQIRIYDNFFTKNNTTCLKELNYKTTEDFELNNGERNFFVKDIEVYSIEAIEI